MQTRTATLVAASAFVLGLGVAGFGLRPLLEAASRGAETCAVSAKPMSRLELLFGTARKGGPPVGDQEWRAFVDTEITPRFPAGLTILDGAGQWRGADGVLKTEHTHVLLVWYEPTTASSADIEAIRAAYKARFGQESVLRVDDRTACISF